ncbi:response regulator [Devosia sp. BK]|uniref:hybrid sensor histidine kinase/response regulator n=1 Tax=Devosia sp. BK TaxID=2871706 RepID=UPI00293A7C85|nr:response regulator [Devosia sp. BK]MDV3253158.1 response regulator [Devosia sp. BK]
MTNAPSRTLALPADLEAFVSSQLAEGRYSSEGDLLAAALRQLRVGSSTVFTVNWPVDGGACGALIRGIDWTKTTLGPVGTWPHALRATVANIVNSPVAKVLMWGPEHLMFYNDAYAPIIDQRHPIALGQSVATALPEVWDFNRGIIERTRTGERISHSSVPITLNNAAGAETYTFDLHYTPVYDDLGTVNGVMCTVIDQTEQMALQRNLAASVGRFRAAMDAVHGVLWTNSADGRMLGEQPGWAKLTGQSFDEYQNFGWSNAVHPDDQDSSVQTWNDAVAAKSMYVHEHRVREKSGVWRTFAIRAVPILDAGGEIIEWIGVHTDITHRRAAENALRQLNEDLEARVISEIDERRRAEAKLAQSQKMETVGKLTGGVAHDFNNLLQVVSGNLQLLAKDIAGNERAERRIANAMAGVSRGSKLASQLLAFGRRQALEPKVTNISRLVRDMDDMLRRAIGEAIEVETVVSGGLWNTFIDPVQVENALLNLAINARDAMDGQGQLTIELGNAHLDDDYARSHDEVTPGQYVMLAVSDTGSGMSPDIIDKVFEPFFSTKGEGKGSGLGLSMVYGFTKQSGGHVKIYSEVGLGTTIKLYLPRALESEDVEVVASTGPIIGGTETVLVVEDDHEVRATVVEMLTDLGYRVLKAVDAASALNVIESGMPIDILFTDVVMPGTLKSPELARKARERLPDIAVLFTSGYTENSIVHGGRLDAGVDLLSKPYTREALAWKFRQVLGKGEKGKPLSDLKAENPIPTEGGRPVVTTKRTVLLVEDDALIRFSTADLLEEAGYLVVAAGSAEEAVAALDTAPVDILVTDINLPGISGVELARQAKAKRPDLKLVFATGDTSAIKDQPDAQVLIKPYSQSELVRALAASGKVPATAK